MRLLGIPLMLMVIGSSVFAATNGYELKMELSRNGQPLSSPRVVVKAGEVATISQKTNTEETFVEVVATEDEGKTDKGILIEVVIGTIDSNGQRTIISSPRLLAKENEPARIQVKNKDGEMSLSVVAKRRAL